MSNLDGVPLDGDGGDVGQVGARWVAIDGWPSWLAWRRQDHGGGGRSRSRRGGRGRRLLFRERRKVREKNPNQTELHTSPVSFTLTTSKMTKVCYKIILLLNKHKTFNPNTDTIILSLQWANNTGHLQCF